MRILINATNLHVGGGVQVASSFIFELSQLLKSNNSVLASVLCSSKVYENLPSNLNIEVFSKFDILDIRGSIKPELPVIKAFSGYDVCFTVFGPVYFTPKVKAHICGFAQPWIAYPRNVAYRQLSLIEYIKAKIKFKIQSSFFRRYDHLIVEQEHVKVALSRLNFNSDEISVISNCLSSIYDDEEQWLPLNFNNEKLINEVTLGFIGRPYVHKNVTILNEVNDILINKFNMRCNFLFTFSPEEMKLCGFTNNSNFYTVGELSASQCPAFYNSLDALVFPSLLECFSASPIEAMKMKTSVIASDYPFVKEVCQEAAFYFNPLSADSIATSIFDAFSNDELRKEKRKLGVKLVSELPTAKHRAESYLNIIQNSIKPNY